MKQLFSTLALLLLCTPLAAVTPPAGLHTTTYYLLAYSFMTSDNPTYQIKVASDGKDIYIQGLFQQMPEAWIQGTMGDDFVVTFPSGQYLGEIDPTGFPEQEHESNGVYMRCTTDMQNTTPLQIAYTPQNDTFEAYYQYLLFTDEEGVPFEHLQNITFFSGIKELITAPTDMELLTYKMVGTDCDTNKEVSYNVTIGQDGYNLYIKGICEAFPESWVYGVRGNDGVVRFLRNQYLGETDVLVHGDEGNVMRTFSIWFTGIDQEERYFSTVDFLPIAQSRDFALRENNWMVFNGDPAAWHHLNTLRDVTLTYVGTQDETDPLTLVVPPTGLSSMATLTVTGTDHTFTPSGEPLEPYNVTCALDGNTIYIQGLFSDIPEAWIKGHLEQTGSSKSAVFPSRQYLGKWYGQMDTWAMGHDDIFAIKPMVFSCTTAMVNNQQVIGKLTMPSDLFISFSDKYEEVSELAFNTYGGLTLTNPALEGIHSLQALSHTAHASGKYLQNGIIIRHGSRCYDITGRSLWVR